MKVLKSKFARRLASARGESITEVLVAIVIGAMAILLMAMAISASSNMVSKGREAMDEYYAANEKLASGDGAATFSGTVTIKDGGTEIVKAGVEGYSTDQFNGDLIAIYSYKEASGGGGGA